MDAESPTTSKISNINERNWNYLLDAIDKERVVPIIGDEFFYISDDDSEAECRVDNYLIRELCNRFKIDFNNADFVTIAEAIEVENFRNRRNAGSKTDLYYEIDSILRRSKIKCRSNIEDFLSIGKFPLILTTSYIPGLESILSASYGEITIKTYDQSSRNDIDNNLSSAKPTLYYLFGKESRVNKSYMVTDDDFLDYLHRWHNSETRPRQISSYLSGKFLLVLGCNYPNWLFRFFWHSIKNFSLTTTSDMQGVVTRNNANQDLELARFLSRIQTEIFENSNIFIKEFFERWDKRRFISTPPLPEPEIDVFLSYADEDKEEARKVAKKLEDFGASVWFDKTSLISSDIFENVIEDRITKAKRFVPIISQTTLKPGRRFFRKEWAMAIREMDFRYGMPYFAPIIIDNSDINCEQIPKPFKEAHAIRISAEDYEIQLKKLIRSFR